MNLVSMRDHEKPAREIVWLTAWLAVANASNSTSRVKADEWADHCLEQFEKRFGKED